MGPVKRKRCEADRNRFEKTLPKGGVGQAPPAADLLRPAILPRSQSRRIRLPGLLVGLKLYCVFDRWPSNSAPLSRPERTVHFGAKLSPGRGAAPRSAKSRMNTSSPDRKSTRLNS